MTQYDGDGPDADIPELQPGFTINSAMTIDEANRFLADDDNTPKYVEVHTADDGEVGYEVIFWHAE